MEILSRLCWPWDFPHCVSLLLSAGCESNTICPLCRDDLGTQLIVIQTSGMALEEIDVVFGNQSAGHLSDENLEVQVESFSDSKGL